MTTYKKADIVEKLSERLDMTKRETDRFIDIFFEELAEIMKENGSVNFSGFGKFEGVRREPRKRSNFKTSQIIAVPEKVVPVFRPSKSLRNYVAGYKDTREE